MKKLVDIADLDINQFIEVAMWVSSRFQVTTTGWYDVITKQNITDNELFELRKQALIILKEQK